MKILVIKIKENIFKLKKKKKKGFAALRNTLHPSYALCFLIGVLPLQTFQNR